MSTSTVTTKSELRRRLISRVIAAVGIGVVAYAADSFATATNTPATAPAAASGPATPSNTTDAPPAAEYDIVQIIGIVGPDKKMLIKSVQIDNEQLVAKGQSKKPRYAEISIVDAEGAGHICVVDSYNIEHCF